MNKISRIAFLILTVTLSACLPATPTTQIIQDSETNNVHVIVTNPTETLIDTEDFNLPNCGGTSELNQTLGTQASVTKSVTIGANATIKGGGEAEIPALAKLELAIEVEGAYQNTYESANSRLDTISMQAEKGTHVIYTIGWYEQTYSSLVEYSSNGQVYEAPYIYKLRIPKIENSNNESCPTNSNGETTNNNPTAIPQAQLPSNSTETPTWSFFLEYHFPAGFWSPGTHQYTFSTICTNEAPESSTREFVASESYSLITGDVYLKWSALRAKTYFGDIVEGINPSQSTVAATAWNQITKSEADWRAANCTGTILWDNGAPQPLTPLQPIQP